MKADVDVERHYGCMQPAMANEWREQWGLSRLPFYYVQLHPFTAGGPYGSRLWMMRDTQARLVDWRSCMVRAVFC